MSKKIIFILIGIILVIAISVFGFFYLRKPQAKITDPLLKKIKTEGKIVIGTDATYPPMESINEKGEFVGFDIDLGKEIAKDLGVNAEFKNIVWDEIFNALLNKEVDIVISSVTITPERAKIMAFSDPYFNAGQVIVTTVEKTKEIKGKEDLAGKKLGVQIETTSEREAKKLTDPQLVISYENYDLAVNDLLAGKIDAIIIDYPAAFGVISKSKNLKIVGEPFTQEFYGVVLRKEDTVLLGEINKTIRRLKNEGILKELEAKWFSR